MGETIVKRDVANPFKKRGVSVLVVIHLDTLCSPEVTKIVNIARQELSFVDLACGIEHFNLMS